MQQRYYDPIAARFLSTDPVTTDQKTGDLFNRYVYGRNNPYRYTDPDGRIAIADDAVIGAGVLIVGCAMSSGCRGAIADGARSAADAVGKAGDAVKNAINAVANAASSGDSGSKSPPLPDKLVGTVDDKSGQQGNRVNNGPLAPEHGGTGDAAKDFGKLTGGKTGEAGTYPGTRGENGIGLRPGKEGEGPRIDIPANGNKPAETLHYPKPEIAK